MSFTAKTGGLRLLLAVAAALLAQPASAAQDEKPELPTSVTATQKQQARWLAAFNGWRSAKWKWPGETEAEAGRRRETRLVIVPDPMPSVSRQRWLDGRSIVISSGLLALVDELLLAEAVADKACFDAYARHARLTIYHNRESLNATPPRTLAAWPRLTALVEAGKAGLIEKPYASTPDGRVDGPCHALTRTQLRSTDTQARIADSTDALALWLFTQQSLQLAGLPSIDDAASAPEKPCSAASASTAKDDPNTRKTSPQKREVTTTLPAASQVQVQVQLQVQVQIAPPAPTACPPDPAASVPSPDEGANQALQRTGRPPLYTVAWLQRNMWLVDANRSTRGARPGS